MCVPSISLPNTGVVASGGMGLCGMVMLRPNYVGVLKGSMATMTTRSHLS